MNLSINATTPDVVLWLVLAALLAVFYYFKHKHVARAAIWARRLVEDDAGCPSLRRTAFAFALVSTVAILFLNCKWPEIITQDMVDAMEKMLIFVGAAWAGRGTIGDIADLLKRRGDPIK